MELWRAIGILIILPLIVLAIMGFWMVRDESELSRTNLERVKRRSNGTP